MTELLVRPVDDDQRRLAAGELDQNIMVLAGAGTGKTSLLIDRLALLILAKGHAVEKIVALTFTKKAAEEMRERLEQRLRGIVSVLSGEAEEDASSMLWTLLREKFISTKPEWEKRARQALEDIPKSQIGTIHSFAGYLLRLYPLQADVDPNFREDDGAMFEVIFDREWNLWLSSELGTEAPRADAWRRVLGHVELSELKELAAQMVSPTVDLSRLQIPTDICSYARTWLAQLRELLAVHPLPAEAPKFSETIDVIEYIFKEVAAGREIQDDRRESVAELKLSWPKSWSGSDEPDAVAQMKNFSAIAKQLAGVRQRLMQQVVEILAPFVKRVRAELNREGAVSFDGLLVYARNLVRDHAEVREALKNQFATFLIDEFQDTDPLQGEILIYLAEEADGASKNWRDAKLAAGKLFVVGDPKQSIYRFRGADIGAFQEFRRLMIDQGALEAELSANFRSHEKLLNCVNAMFPLIMKEEAGLQPAYNALKVGRPSSAQGGLEMVVVNAGDDDGPLSDEYRRFEGEHVAEMIAAATARPGGPTYQDFAILLRSTNAFLPYLDALKRAGIPYLAEGEKFFYRTPEVMDFLNLLSVIAHPDDKLALVGVLRSSLGGLTDREILDLSNARGLDFRRPPPLHARKISQLYARLKILSATAHDQPVYETIHRVLAETWILELASRSNHGEQAMANLLKIPQLARRWSEKNPITLGQFIRLLKKYRDDERDEGENPLADVRYNAVKVMTVHKAKGLEFSRVILPNLSRQSSNGQTDRPVLQSDWRTGLLGLRLKRSGAVNGAMVVLEAEIRKREEAEEIRVFYVAATRAKQKMIFYLRSEQDSGPYAKLLQKANVWPEASCPHVQIADEKVPVTQIHWAPGASSKRAASGEIVLPPDWKLPAAAEQYVGRMKEARDVLGRVLITSPSRLLTEPEKFRIVDEEAVASREKAALLGEICHKVLEEWNFGIKPESIEKNLARSVERACQMFELHPGESLYSELSQEALSILESFLKSETGARLSRVKIVGREIPFLHYLGAGEPHAMRGRLDLVYEENGELIVADYKTSQIKKQSTSELAARYQPQGEAYQRAVESVIGRKPVFEILFLRNSVGVRL